MPITSEDPIIVAPSPTPFDRDDAVDFEAIERNIVRWLETPLSGFVLNSENGEETFLSESERLEIVRTVRRVSDGKKIIIGGVDCPSVTETLRTAEALAEAGAELIRIRIPRLTSNVSGYFESVIPRAAAPVVIIHQMAPGMFLSGPAPIGAPAELIGEWASLDNVFGYIASADLRFEARVRTHVSAEKRFWMGNASLLLAGAALGANGACMMLGNVAPTACRDIMQLAMAGKFTDAQSIQMRILETDWQILAHRAAGVKAALNLLGFDAGSPRQPSPPCTVEQIARIRAEMQKASLLDPS